MLKEIFRNSWFRCRYLLVLGLSLFLLVQGSALGFDTEAREALLLDFNTGAVLLAKNEHQAMPPASMSKLMTVYLIFERLKDGSLRLDDTMRVSEKAWRMRGSRMFVEVDTEVPVADLLRGIIVQSGNDACVVVAEAIAGSESAFAELMTRRAREIGLTNSNFMNATGWPDRMHYMSAVDLATLTKRIVLDFPEYFPLFSELTFDYNDIEQSNRNPLLFDDIGADGMKTGHTEAAGYGLTATAERNGRRLILVVNGLESARKRASESKRLLEYGFREFENLELFKTGETVEKADVWLGEVPRLPLIIDQPVSVTVPRAKRDSLRVSVRLDSPIPAPIAAGHQVAQLVVEIPDFDTMRYPLRAAQDVPQLGMFGRLGAALSYLLFGPPIDS